MISLEQQVSSLEPSKRLKELGVKHESLFTWKKYHWPSSKSEGKWTVEADLPSLSPVSEELAAFTVAELGEMLPAEVEANGITYGLTVLKNEKSWQYYYFGGEYESSEHTFQDFDADADTEADARAKMLIYLIEQGIVKP